MRATAEYAIVVLPLCNRRVAGSEQHPHPDVVAKEYGTVESVLFGSGTRRPFDVTSR